MPISISKHAERPFAITPKVHSPCRQYTLTAANAHGTIQHSFVELDAALAKIRELMILEYGYISLAPRLDVNSDKRH